MAFSLHKLEIGGDQTAGQATAYLADPQAAGDYYSESQRAPMIWAASAPARVALGLGASVELWKVEALLSGRHPYSGELLRRFGPSRTMIGGIDVTLSPAPKSVSVLWAMAGDSLRRELEGMVVEATAGAMAVMTHRAPLVRQRYGPGTNDVQAIQASDVVGVQVLHTTARISETKASVPDPNLHAHTVLFGDLREDGKLRAIESRSILRFQEELDAFASGSLAELLQERGFQIERKLIYGPGGHVKRVGWELRGVPEALIAAMSGRSQEISDLAKEYRATYGRAAEGPGWDRWISARRGPKSKKSAEELRQAWRLEGEQLGFGALEAARLDTDARRTAWQEPSDQSPEAEQLRREILETLCRVHAMVPMGRLHALAQQRALGLVTPARAGHIVADLFGSGDLLLLENGMATTLQVIAHEQRAERALHQLLDSTPSEAATPEQLQAEFDKRENEGRPFDPEQREAITLALSGARFVSIAGPAGTGKGYAAQAMVDVWHAQERRVLALAVAGRTAQQFAHDSGATPMTLNQLQARTESSSLQLRATDVLLIDEAAMIDHERYADVLDTAAQATATVVQIGDDHQLSPVEAGGLWTVFHQQAQQQGLAVELRTVRRTRDPAEGQAWTDFREGRVQEALSWYYDQQRLQLYDQRPQLLQGMVASWWTHNPAGVMVVDSSNAERDTINRLAQAKRLEAGELGAEALQLTNGRELRTGDRVLFTEEPYYLPGQPTSQRVENGTEAVVRDLVQDTDISQNPRALLELQEPNASRLIEAGPEVNVELAYARHIAKGQGMTAPTADVAVSEQTSHETLYTMVSRSQDGTQIHALRAEVEGLEVDVKELENAERTHLQPAEPEHLEQMPLDGERETDVLRMFNETEIRAGQVVSFDEALPLRQPTGVEQGELGVVRSVSRGGMTWDYGRVELVGGRQVNVYQPDPVQPVAAEIKADQVLNQVPRPDQRNPHSLSVLPLNNGAIIQRDDLVRFGEPAPSQVPIGAEGRVVDVDRHAHNSASVQIDGIKEPVAVYPLTNLEITQPAGSQPEAAQASIDQLSKQASRSSAKEAINHLEAAPPTEPERAEHHRIDQDMEVRTEHGPAARQEHDLDHQEHQRPNPAGTQHEPSREPEQQQPTPTVEHQEPIRQPAVDRSPAPEPIHQAPEHAPEPQGIER